MIVAEWKMAPLTKSHDQFLQPSRFNLLVPDRCNCDQTYCRLAIFILILKTDIVSILKQIALQWMLQDLSEHWSCWLIWWVNNGAGNGLVPWDNKAAITWTNADQVLWCHRHVASLDLLSRPRLNCKQINLCTSELNQLFGPWEIWTTV